MWNKNISNYKFVLSLTYYLDTYDETTLIVFFTFSHPNLFFKQGDMFASQLIMLDIMFTCSVTNQDKHKSLNCSPIFKKERTSVEELKLTVRWLGEKKKGWLGSRTSVEILFLFLLFLFFKN